MDDRLTEKESCVKRKTELFSTLASAVLLTSGQIESAGRHNVNYTNTAFNKTSGYKAISNSSTSERDISLIETAKEA